MVFKSKKLSKLVFNILSPVTSKQVASKNSDTIGAVFHLSFKILPN